MFRPPVIFNIGQWDWVKIVHLYNLLGEAVSAMWLERVCASECVRVSLSVCVCVCVRVSVCE